MVLNYYYFLISEIKWLLACAFSENGKKCVKLLIGHLSCVITRINRVLRALNTNLTRKTVYDEFPTIFYVMERH